MTSIHFGYKPDIRITSDSGNILNAQRFDVEINPYGNGQVYAPLNSRTPVAVLKNHEGLDTHLEAKVREFQTAQANYGQANINLTNALLESLAPGEVDPKGFGYGTIEGTHGKMSRAWNTANVAQRDSLSPESSPIKIRVNA